MTTLKDLLEEIEDLIDEYGEDCPVKSNSQLETTSQTPCVWYDEDKDAVIID